MLNATGGSSRSTRTPCAVAGADARVVSPTHPPVRTAVSQASGPCGSGGVRGFEAGGAAVLAHGGVVAGAVVRVDERERLAGQIGKRDGAALRERVPFADGEHRALLAHDVAAHAVGGLAQNPSAISSSPAATSRTSTPVLSCRALHAQRRALARELGERRLRDVVRAGREPERERPGLTRRRGCGRRPPRPRPRAPPPRRGSSTARPASESSTRCGVRSSSRTPSWRSSRAICWLSAGWVMCSRRPRARSAAPPRAPRTAAAGAGRAHARSLLPPRKRNGRRTPPRPRVVAVRASSCSSRSCSRRLRRRSSRRCSSRATTPAPAPTRRASPGRRTPARGPATAPTSRRSSPSPSAGSSRVPEADADPPLAMLRLDAGAAKPIVHASPVRRRARRGRDARRTRDRRDRADPRRRRRHRTHPRLGRLRHPLRRHGPPARRVLPARADPEHPGRARRARPRAAHAPRAASGSRPAAKCSARSSPRPPTRPGWRASATRSGSSTEHL